MLSAVRELSEEQEKTRKDIRAEFQAEKDQHLEELRGMLASIRQTREAEKVLLPNESQDCLVAKMD